MAHVHVIEPSDADGALHAIYAQAERRAGRVYNILRVQGLNPAALQASIDLYLAVVHGPSPLSRVEREAIAVTVSRVNECFY